MNERQCGIKEGGWRPRMPTGLREFRPFPIEVLPDLLRRYVEAHSVALHCEASYIVLPMLSMLGAAIGNSRVLELKKGWCEPPIIWALLVGESGTMKSPAFRAALQPMRTKQTAAIERHQLEVGEYRREKAAYEVESKRWRREAADSADGAMFLEQPVEPKCPTLDRYIMNDTTLEALLPVLEENPRGVLIAWDELSGWFGSFDRYVKSGSGGGDMAKWLSMHSAEMLIGIMDT